MHSLLKKGFPDPTTSCVEISPHQRAILGHQQGTQEFGTTPTPPNSEAESGSTGKGAVRQGRPPLQTDQKEVSGPPPWVQVIC